MTSIYYYVPSTLLREKELLEAKCSLLIEAFNSLCGDEVKRLREEEQAALAAIEWVYEVKTIENGWLILYKEAVVPVASWDSNEQWGKPFKIVNGVCVHADFYHKQKNHTAANNLLPKNGDMVPVDFDATSLIGW